LLTQIFRGPPFNRKDSHQTGVWFCARFADCEPLKTSFARNVIRNGSQINFAPPSLAAWGVKPYPSYYKS